MNVKKAAGRWPCFYLVILFLPVIAWGQHYNFKNYSIEEGLAQSQVRVLYQSGSGYLWIGTLGGGVSRFDGTDFTNFTKKDGLPDNRVVSIFEDSQGNIWFGTYAGVSRYDGTAFSPLNTGTSLSNSTVRAIAEDREGNLWFGSEKGIWKYDGEKYSYLTGKDGLTDDAVRSIYVDREGKIWLGTENGAIIRYDGLAITSFSEPKSSVNRTVYSILQDRRGNIWFGTHSGVSKYDGEHFRDFTSGTGLSINNVRAIIEDGSGNLWFGSDSGGICKFDGKDFTYITEKNGLSSNAVWSLLEDREGNIWIGSYRGGLDKYSGDLFSYFSSQDGLGDDQIRSILQDSRGNFWFGTYRGGVSRYDGENITTFTTKDGLINDFVLTIFEDSRGNFWFGTFAGVSKYDGKRFFNISRKDGLSDKVIRAVFEDRVGDIWFGTNTSGIDIYDGKTIRNITTADGLPGSEITTITADGSGLIWIGTLNGIGCYDGETFTNISRICGLKQKDIYSITGDKKGNLWLAAYGDGIVKFSPPRVSKNRHPPRHSRHPSVGGEDFNYYRASKGLPVLSPLERGGPPQAGRGVLEPSQKNKILTHSNTGCSYEVFDRRGDGLYDDNVVSLVFDDSGTLWIGTEKGICSFDVELYEKTGEPKFKHYGKEEGLIGIECIHNSIFKDRRGKLWFGTINGAIKYNPDLEKMNEIPPLTHITDLRLFFGEEPWLDYANDVSPKNGLPLGLRLPYNKNYLEFDFIGISLTAPGKVKYQFKLAGFDEVWVPGSERSYAGYPNLPPGKYTFKVKACNNDRVWNEEPASFSFEILPPFWKTWWFYLLCAVLAATLVSLFIKIRLNSLEKQQRILKEEVKKATADLEKEKEKVEKINLELEDRVRERTAELRESEERLLHAQKMEAIGTMAGGIAHDFNNLLMGILGNVSLILSEIGEGHPYHTELSNIEQYVQSGASLTRQLLGFARGGKYEATPTDLNRLIKNSAEMFGHTRKEITIRGKYEPELYVVEVDQGQVEQVLVNLYVNAWQAMPGGGNIYIQTENVTLEEQEVSPYGLEPGNYVKISITDTGEGMDEATKQKIFEPFFTTREMGRGIGLGLASAYGIVKNHGGAIEVESEKGKGTTFTIYLPASEKQIIEEEEVFKSYARGTETLLLVDDEVMVREVGGKILRKLGYRVLTAGSGQEAVKVFKKNREKIDLIILDVIMPGMDGPEAYDKLKEIYPQAAVLVSSGYSLDGQAKEMLERGCLGFIQKPFSLEDLSKKIRLLLDNKK